LKDDNDKLLLENECSFYFSSFDGDGNDVEGCDIQNSNNVNGCNKYNNNRTGMILVVSKEKQQD